VQGGNIKDNGEWKTRVTTQNTSHAIGIGCGSIKEWYIVRSNPLCCKCRGKTLEFEIGPLVFYQDNSDADYHRSE